MRGEEGLVRLLLDRGADACAVDWEGNTALMRAARHGDAGTLALLVRRATRHVDKRNRRGDTPLMGAAEREDGAEGLRVLMAARPDLEARNEEVRCW